LIVGLRKTIHPDNWGLGLRFAKSVEEKRGGERRGKRERGEGGKGGREMSKARAKRSTTVSIKEDPQNREWRFE